MSDDKRIYELDPAMDTQGKLIMVDTVSASDATFIPVPYHMVSTLPASPIGECLYYLTETDRFAPKGVYIYDNGWICKTCLEVLMLPDAYAGVTMLLYSGASYIINITNNITSVDITLTADGICRILIDNPSLFTIDGLYGGYKTTNFGLDALSAGSVRFTIQRDTVLGSVSNEYTTVERIPTDPIFPT